MKQLYVSVLFLGLIAAPNAYAEVAYNYPIYSSGSFSDTSSDEKIPSNDQATTASSTDIKLDSGMTATTSATSTQPTATTTDVVKDEPDTPPVFRGVGSKFQTLVAPPVQKAHETITALWVGTSSTSTPETDDQVVAGAETGSMHEAAKSAQALQQSAQDFENATKPITTKIKQIVFKILSIFSW